MESLAYLVVITLMVFILAGPLALLLTLIKPSNKVFKIINRLLQALVLIFSLLASLEFIINLSKPLGIYGLIMIYLTLAREYFPEKKLVRSALRKVLKRDKGRP